MGHKDHANTDETQAVENEQTDGDGVDLPRRFDNVLNPLLAAGHSQRVAAERAVCAKSVVERRVQDPLCVSS